MTIYDLIIDEMKRRETDFSEYVKVSECRSKHRNTSRLIDREKTELEAISVYQHILDTAILQESRKDRSGDLEDLYRRIKIIDPKRNNHLADIAVIFKMLDEFKKYIKMFNQSMTIDKNENLSLEQVVRSHLSTKEEFDEFLKPVNTAVEDYYKNISISADAWSGKLMEIQAEGFKHARARASDRIYKE